MFRIKIWDHCRYVREKAAPYPEMLRHLQICAAAGIDTSIIYLPEVISLPAYCQAAAKAGLKVEARIFPAWQNPAPVLRTLPDEKWTEMQERFGITLRGACLNHPDNQANFLEQADRLCQEFSGQLSAISLDFIRNDNAVLLLDYPCECSACRQLRQHYFGKEVLTAAEAAEPAVLYKELEIRCSMVQKLVEGVKKICSQHGLDLTMAARANYLNEPDITVAPVWGLGPAVIEGQDWVDWVERGLIDAVYPMNYHTDEALFTRLLHDHCRLLHPNKNKLFSGIGVSSSMGELSPAALEKHLLLVKEQGLPGAVLFNKSNIYSPEQLKIIRKMIA
ncbi:MAG: hypothetical protein GX927_01395 [Lentisphaerae bacterium]|jgi:hypothetical protein|nr:hypothetical protein [Lentisphaerota bacterium]